MATHRLIPLAGINFRGSRRHVTNIWRISKRKCHFSTPRITLTASSERYELRLKSCQILDKEPSHRPTAVARDSSLRLRRRFCYRFRKPKLQNGRPAPTLDHRSRCAGQLRSTLAKVMFPQTVSRSTSRLRAPKLEVARSSESCFWKLFDMQY